MRPKQIVIANKAQYDGVVGILGNQEGVVVVLCTHGVVLEVEARHLALVHKISDVLQGEVKGQIRGQIIIRK